MAPLPQAHEAESSKEALSVRLLEEIRTATPLQEEQARRRLGALWTGDVLHWCRWLCNARQDPEDLAQDVLVVLLRDAHLVRDPARLRSWVFGVTWRLVRADRRRAWFRLRDPGQPWEHLSTPALDERTLAVRRLLAELPLETRVLLCLRYIEGHSRAEMAEMLGMPAGTLSHRMKRARATFAKRASRRGLGPVGAGP